jgi:hypothetical protein
MGRHLTDRLGEANGVRKVVIVAVVSASMNDSRLCSVTAT